ncbi:MAG: CerR family C-terminal domain-containing protein [Candidatus Hydrogenedentes bacterium]|nr:CerR family C-terminal domain-containing protein [Candidatus Hydrogenedentota bacterium]
MTERTKGLETRQRILEEACKVFGEKGFRDATHADICSRAGANVAAINYYFGTKENLYRAVFEHLSERSEVLYPFGEGLSEDAAPEVRLYAFIHAFLGRVFDQEELMQLHHIRMAEMFASTGLLDDLMERHLASVAVHISGILQLLLGPGASARDLEWCGMCVVGQCLIGAYGPQDDKHRHMLNFSAADLDSLAEHIHRFSLAGIEAIRQRSNAHAEKGHLPLESTRTELETDDEQSQ